MAIEQYTCDHGQTIFDVVNMKYGSANFVQDFLTLNGFTYNTNLRAGDVVLYDSDGVGDQNVKDFYNRRTANDRRKNTAANYIEYKASDYDSEDFDEDDYS